MTKRIHPPVQDADDGDAVTRRPEIDDVLLDAAPTIAGPDMAAALRPLRRVSKLGAGGFDEVGVAHRLGQAPLRRRVIEHLVEVTLRPRAESIISHPARLCAA